MIWRKRDWRAGARRALREAGDAITDAYLDARISRALRRLRSTHDYQTVQPLKILAFGIQSPKRGDSLNRIFDRFSSKKHQVDCISREVGSFGKVENSNILLSTQDLSSYDYVLMTDDDVIIPNNFIDDVVAISEIANLDIAGPAHRLCSFHNYEITRRKNGGLLRLTNYVEVGPIVIFRSNTFSYIFPFPVTKYSWGVDLLWSKVADENRWRMGIIDGTPIKHLSPAGSTYDWDAAHIEMEEFKKINSIKLDYTGFSVIQRELRF